MAFLNQFNKKPQKSNFPLLIAAFMISTSGLVVNFIKRGDAKGAENDGRTLQGETVLIGHFGAAYLAYQKRN